MKPSSLDPELIANIKELQMDGAPDVLGELADLFLESMKGPVESLQKAFADKDFAMMAETAHMLKSGSANVGALHLSEICRAIEATGQAQTDVSNLSDLEKQFTAEFQAVTQELQTLRSFPKL